jgi:uncharacterized membrane protein (DUF485 family)
MEELKKWEELTKEEQVAMTKLLSKARFGLLFAAFKFLLGLFVSNILTLAFGHYLLGDPSETTWFWFCLVTSIVNSIFLSRYFSSQMDKNNDILMSKIKEILKKQ